MDAHVYERREVIAGGEGTMIVIAPNGVNVLGAINPELIPLLKEAGVESPMMEAYSMEGTLLSRTRMGCETEESKGLKYGTPFINIGWNNTLSVLRDALPPHTIHTGHTFTGLVQTDESVSVRFTTTSGETVSVQAEVVVGADGVRSKVRREVCGEGKEGTDTNDALVDGGRMVFRALVDYDTASPHIKMLERGTNYSFFGAPKTFLLSDAGSNMLYMAFTVLDSLWEQTVSEGTGEEEESQDRATLVLSRLKTIFKGCPAAEESLGVLSPGDLLERRIQYCPVLEKWVNKRVVLIGDAAHTLTPAIGQGANQAFEDALDLSVFLDNDKPVVDALLEFEKFRLPRVKMVEALNLASSAASYKKEGTEQVSVWNTWDDIFFYKGAHEALKTAL